MDSIITVFRIGTGFASACRHYLLVRKISDLKSEIDLIKGSFFEAALEFVQKASTCQNDSNSRFFLESAYGNFSQSALVFSNSTDKFFDVAFSDGFTSSIVDVFKSSGTGLFSRGYNSVVSGVEKKITSSDEKKQKLEWGCNILEMSHVGKAMCEYWMKEYDHSVESIDKAIGVHMDLYWKIVRSTSAMIPEMFKSTIGRVYTKILQLPIQECENYFTIQNTIATERGVPIVQLENRNKVITILRKGVEKGDCFSHHFLESVFLQK